MITPATLNLTAQRWTPFDYSIQLPVGLDFTGATAALQARLRPDAPGSPIINLVNAAVDTQGLSFTHVTASGVVTSTLRIQIAEATLEAVLLNAGKAPSIDRREDVRISHDIHITGGGFIKTRWFEGVLTIRGGSTQNA